MTENDARLLEKAMGRSKIFSRCSAEDMTRLAHSGAFALIAASDGEEINTGEPPFPGLGVVLCGRFIVWRCDCGHMVTLNELSTGDSFGAAAMFSDGKCEQVTQVLAKGASKLAVIREDDFRRMLLENADICTGYITFLSDRIRFLNGKVRTFSGSTSAKKVANALLSSQQDGICAVGSCAEFARRINIGRASLYRALDSMEQDGLIRRSGSSIEIIDIEGLKGI